MKHRKGKLAGAGKTKKIYRAVGNPDWAILQYLKKITKFDDATLTREFGMKGVFSNTVNCNVFELLRRAGLPVAYIEKASPTAFVAWLCQMLKLEVVIRRHKIGSYLLRHPDQRTGEGELPGVFPVLEVEFFLKTSGGKLIAPDGRILVRGLDPKQGQEDPLIINPYDPIWTLHHPKLPKWDDDVDLSKTVRMREGLGALTDGDYLMRTMEDIIRNVFLVLERAFGMLGYRLQDLKLEFGIGPDGELYVADVIDPDSFRLVDILWNMFSKQAFRAGEDLVVVAEKYRIVSELSKSLRIPKSQVLVLWSGSPNDPVPDTSFIDLASIGVEVIEVVESGHKRTEASLNRLREIERDHPEGGVILVSAGKSNGLGPILAAHTDWQVISIPVGVEKDPRIIWSSVDMPSKVPNLVILNSKNAVAAALKDLSRTNPAVYAYVRRQIEDRLAA